MAELNRTAKSGSEWTINELLAYRIIFKSISPIQFFSSPNPSLDHLDPAVLEAAPGTIDAQMSKQTVIFLSSLDFAIVGNYRAYIDDFARETLYLLGFADRYMVISTRHTIPLTICGKTSETAETNVCIVYLPRPTLILLVLVTDDSTSSGGTNAEAQVVAGAVAAFQFNNNNRESLNLAPMEVMTIPCITLSGTSPTFYLVPVSQSLSNAVATGQYPPTQTDVFKCVTSLDASDSIGMGNTEYRRLALQRFLAFKILAESHWKEIVQGVHDVLSKLLQVPCSLRVSC